MHLAQDRKQMLIKKHLWYIYILGLFCIKVRYPLLCFHILPAFSQEIFSASASNSRERFFCTWIAIENMCLGSWLSIAQTELLTHDLGNRAEMQSDTHCIKTAPGL